MISIVVLVLGIFSTPSTSIDVRFPPWFQFGASTAAYQVEGAWNVSDKAVNIWDKFTHEDPSRIVDKSNGDVACNSYYLWERDLEMAAELGLQFYRISIAWTRILPTGYTNKISQSGVRYYNNLIDAMIKRGIEPVVTMHHFDLPQSIQNLGGWTNPLIVKYFGEYTRVLYKLFADRVKIWTTINEPSILCDYVYKTGSFAPGIKDKRIAPLLCSKHVLLAHATAWRIYEKEFEPFYNGHVTLADNLIWLTSASHKDDSITKIATDYTTGRFLHPIFSKEGGWPPSMIKLMNERSAKEGYEWSTLPALNQTEIDFIKGTSTIMDIHYYVSRKCRRAEPGEEVSESLMDGLPEVGVVLENDTAIAHKFSEDVVFYPKGLRELMVYLKKEYGNYPILISENGIGLKTKDLHDEARVLFIREHLEQILLSIYVDKINVIGYTYWSIMDNFEWAMGYTVKFGLYDVDFNSEHRTRTPRTSAKFYKSILKNRSLEVKKCYSKQFSNSYQ